VPTTVANPTGSVVFSDGSTQIGSATVSTTGGVTSATVTVSNLAVGNHAISAAYSGDGNFGSSAGTTNQEVNKAATTTVLASSHNPALPGDSVTFTATVSVNAPGSTAAASPGGTVTFSDGATQIGTGTLSTSGSVTSATFTTSSLGIGAHSVTAAYGGDGNFTASTSGSVVENVGKAPTSTTVISSANPAVVGASVTFTATITPNDSGLGIPNGTVDFFDGSTKLGTATLNGRTVDQATFTTSTLAVGSHTVTAVYSGDGTFAASTSPALNQAVGYSVNLLYDATKAKQSGSTIPIKLQIFDATGKNLDSSSISVTLVSPAVSPDPGGAQPTGAFSLNGDHYQYDLKTTGYAPGSYVLQFTVGNDPTVHTAPFAIK
jgi:hypothetical protein